MDTPFDSIAQWYVEFTRSWKQRPNALLPDDVGGQRILDQACGYGVAARYLAHLGAFVVGVDLSSEMLTHTRRIEEDDPLGLIYLCVDASAIEWWDGQAFDGVLFNMALMDIDDLEGALSVAATVLRPGGWLSVSVFHPCYPGGPEGSLSGLPSWSPDLGYSHEGWWTTKGVGVRGRVGAKPPDAVDLPQRHHPLGLSPRGVCRIRTVRAGNSRRAGTKTAVSATEPAWRSVKARVC